MASIVTEAISLAASAATAADFLRDAGGLLQRAIGADALLGILQGEAAWTAEHVQNVPPEIMRRLASRWTTYQRELAPVFDMARTAGAAIDVKVLGASLQRSAYQREIMDEQGAKSTAIVLLKRRESVLGAFVLGRRSHFSAHEEARLGELAPALGLGLAALRAPVAATCTAAAERGLGSVILALSAREREFADYVCLGYSNQQIALACGVSPNTVRNRLVVIYDRLGVGTRAELASLITRFKLGPR